MIDHLDTYQDMKSALTELANTRDLIPFHFAAVHRDLLEAGIQQRRKQHQQLLKKISDLVQELESLDRRKTDLEMTIARDEVTFQKNNIEKEIAFLEKSRDQKRARLELYNEHAGGLDLPLSPAEKTFHQTIAQCHTQRDELESRLPKLNEDWADLRQEIKILGSRQSEMEIELESLLQRKNQIPLRNIELRERLLQAVGATATEIPFIGELIQVNESARDWEDAIERLLHSFALRLLVPDALYEAVNDYVNSTDLRGRIVYHRLSLKRTARVLVQDHPDLLISRLEFHTDSPYSAWVRNQIASQYDYYCVPAVDALLQHRKALTRQGLIKNGERHEKDDRSAHRNRRRHVLGWDNQRKIGQLKTELKDLDKQVGDLDQKLTQLQKQRKRYESKREKLVLFLQFRDFAEIDWQTDSIKLQALQDERARLLASSNHLLVLEEQLAEIRAEIARATESKECAREQRALLEKGIQDFQLQLDHCHTLLGSAPSSIPDADTKHLQSYLPETTISLANIEQVRQQIFRKIDGLLKTREQEKQTLEKQLRKRMNAYINPRTDIIESFPEWRAETINLLADADYGQEFRDLHDRIANEDLPRHQQRFQKYRDETIINDLASFRTLLDRQLEDIEDSILALNQSLEQIDFNRHPVTYIQLDYQPTTDVTIREFKQMLRFWKPDIGRYQQTGDAEILHRSFLKIRDIIEKLSNEEAWRKKVTDVRNWLTFSAKELNSNDNSQFKFYESSGSLSGGEAAQLTYTILGAAIAYQFGIRHGGKESRSFRFFTVDEAFSKLDPEKSNFLMELCQQLHLQLLVVTPLDKIHVVEPYIAACHYVENKMKRNSEVFDLTMDEYHQKKDAIRSELSDR